MADGSPSLMPSGSPFPSLSPATVTEKISIWKPTEIVTSLDLQSQENQTQNQKFNFHQIYLGSSFQFYPPIGYSELSDGGFGTSNILSSHGKSSTSCGCCS
ncbi:hypothetical protein Hanom_Chr03g00278801 [Helianthus anomalus]